MKTNSPFLGLLVVSGMLVQPLLADLYVTNFETLTSTTVANGVWRNESTATDLAIPVSLTQSPTAMGAVILDELDDDPSVTDDSAPWLDDPITATDLFNPNFTGDYINLEVSGGALVTVVIDFGAQVTDPTLYFTDVDTQTTLDFSTANPTKTGGLGNMLVSGSTVKTSGIPQPLLFGSTEETLGSVKFTGTFTSLEFTIENDGSDPVNDEDRTGFVVSTSVAPVPLSSGPAPMMWVDVSSNNVTIDWGSVGALSEVQMLDDAWNWVPVPGADPTTQSSFVGSKLTLGPTRLFRGVYTP